MLDYVHWCDQVLLATLLWKLLKVILDWAVLIGQFRKRLLRGFMVTSLHEWSLVRIQADNFSAQSGQTLCQEPGSTSHINDFPSIYRFEQINFIVALFFLQHISQKLNAFIIILIKNAHLTAGMPPALNLIELFHFFLVYGWEKFVHC